MDGSHASRFFLEPKQTSQRQYEALRAVFVDAEPPLLVAGGFGYKPSARPLLVCRFRAVGPGGATPPFFSRTVVGDLRDRARAKTDQAPNPPQSRIAGS